MKCDLHQRILSTLYVTLGRSNPLINLTAKAMKNILIPIDFTELSEQVVHVAAKVADLEGGRLHLLHTIYTPTVLEESGFSYAQAAFDAAEREMNTFVERLNLSKQPIVQLEVDPVHIAVDAYVRDNTIDMVMMPSHGATGLKEWLIGSHAERVVRSSSVPVIVLKQPLAYYPPKHMAFASTFELGEHMNIDPLIELQKISGAHMHLVWILKDEEKQPSEEEMLLRMSGFAFANRFFEADYHIIYANDITEGLNKFSQSYYVDLLVIGTHNRNTLSKFFHHSIAEEVVNHLPQNIMTFHIEPEEVLL